jgi:hypothetical protein
MWDAAWEPNLTEQFFTRITREAERYWRPFTLTTGALPEKDLYTLYELYGEDNKKGGFSWPFAVDPGRQERIQDIAAGIMRRVDNDAHNYWMQEFLCEPVEPTEDVVAEAIVDITIHRHGLDQRAASTPVRLEDDPPRHGSMFVYPLAIFHPDCAHLNLLSSRVHRAHAVMPTACGTCGGVITQGQFVIVIWNPSG